MSAVSLVWALPLLCAAATLLLLRPRSGAGAEQIWLLAAAVPLTVALAAALHGQAQAQAKLAGIGWDRSFVTVQNGEQVRGLDLNTEQAACFERVRRLGLRAEWLSGGEAVRVTPQSRVRGPLPPPELAQQLAIQGRLNCRQWVRVLPEQAEEQPQMPPNGEPDK